MRFRQHCGEGGLGDQVPGLATDHGRQEHRVGDASASANEGRGCFFFYQHLYYLEVRGFNSNPTLRNCAVILEANHIARIPEIVALAHIWQECGGMSTSAFSHACNGDAHLRYSVGKWGSISVIQPVGEFLPEKHTCAGASLCKERYTSGFTIRKGIFGPFLGFRGRVWWGQHFEMDEEKNFQHLLQLAKRLSDSTASHQIPRNEFI